MRLQSALITATLSILLPLGMSVRPSYAQAMPRITYQSPSDYYLKMRRTYPPQPGLTPNMLAEKPGAYEGAVLEVEGRLSGVIRADEGNALLMLSTEKYGSLNLRMTILPNWVQSGTRLRVLVVAANPADGSVTFGMPELLVVAVASASDIAAAENRWRSEASARAAREKERQLALKQAEAQMAAARQPAPNPSSNTARSNFSSRTSAGPRGATARTVNASNIVTALSPEAQAVLPHYQGFVQKWNSRLSAGEAQIIAASILLFSEEYDVDPRLMVAIIIAESDFRPSTTSNKGAMGLGQIMPDEARDLGLSNPYDPIQNIYGAVYLMRGRLNKYSGGASSGNIPMNQIILALASYNAGMGAVKKYNGVPPYRETQNYVKKIERIYRELCGEVGPP